MKNSSTMQKERALVKGHNNPEKLIKGQFQQVSPVFKK